VNPRNMANIDQKSRWLKGILLFVVDSILTMG